MSRKMGIFYYDIDTIKEFLSKKNSNSEKLEFINPQLTTTKRMIDELENTKVVEWIGGESGEWGICTLDGTLSDLIFDAAETERKIFKRQVTEDILQDISEGLKNRLKESYIYLKNEFKSINRMIKISKIRKTEKKIVNTSPQIKSFDSESEKKRGAYNKILDNERIKKYINTAFKNGDIPKSKDKSKTDYKKLRDIEYLRKLEDKIEDKLDYYCKFKNKDIPDQKIESKIKILGDLLADTQQKRREVLKKNYIKERPEKKTIEHIHADSEGETIDSIDNYSGYQNYNDWKDSEDNPENYIDNN